MEMMKIIKMMFFTFCLMAFSTNAQVEISGLLDSDPTDGITDGSVAKYKFPAAIQACRNLIHNGKSDWYLPTVEDVFLFTVNADRYPTNYQYAEMPTCRGGNCDGAHYFFWSRTVMGSGGSEWYKRTVLASGVGAVQYGCYTGETNNYSYADKDGKTFADGTDRIYTTGANCQWRVRCVRN